MPAARNNLLIVFAFLAIYVIWGSTYFAIRVAVENVPPFFAAGMRFVIAGILLLGYVLLRRLPLPTLPEWRNLTFSGLLLFVPAYGGLFWAERTVPSGIAAALVATIPVWIALMELFVMKQSKLRWPVVASFLCGCGGVCLLTLRGVNGGSHSLLPYVVILVSQLCWSAGTLMTKNMQLPAAKVVTSGGQMGLGGLMLLLLSAAFGEWRPFPHVSLTALSAILYLTLFGSVIAFTSYVWLLSQFPATTVGSYAYVNPVVALALGYLFGHETLDARVFIGTFLVLVGVALTLRGNRSAH